MASGGDRARLQSFDPPSDAPSYFLDALKDIGVQEWVMSGRRKVSNPLVQRYIAKAMGAKSGSQSEKRWLSTNTISTPWCAYWLNAKLEYAGYTGSRSGMARSFLRWGVEVQESDWSVGDIIVLWRGKKNDGITGHVGFLLHMDDKTLRILGGNQGDQVCIEEFSRYKGGIDKVLGIRRPRSVWKSKTIRANGSAAGNEVAVKPAVDALLPDPDKLQNTVTEIRGPLEVMAQYKPWIMGVLTAITIGLVLYGLYCRFYDHSSGRNT